MTGDNTGRECGTRAVAGPDEGYRICDGVADLLAAYDAAGSVAVRAAAGGWFHVAVALEAGVGGTARGSLAGELDAIFRAAAWYECRHASAAGRGRHLTYVVRPRGAPPAA